MCRVAIIVVTCSGMVVQKRAVSGRIRSALYGSRTADAVPSAEGWWKDKVCVMYSVTIILIIFIVIIDRWMLLFIMIAAMFVVCMMMSSVTSIIVIMHLKTVLKVWIARE